MRTQAEVNATRDALARIAAHGSDLSRPLSMDFFVAVPDEASGQLVAARAEALGFRTNVEMDEPTGKWTCYCTIEMVPQLAAVLAFEQELDAIANDFGGYADGFGTFGNAIGPS